MKRKRKEEKYDLYTAWNNEELWKEVDKELINVLEGIKGGGRKEKIK